MKKTWHFSLFSIMLIAFEACCSLNIPLSKDEMKYKSYLEDKYRAVVVLSHDNEVVKNSGSMGTFSIELKNAEQKLCSNDDMQLKDIVLKIGNEINPILSHKECYQFIAVIFSEYKEMDKISSWRSCMKTFEMKIDSMNLENIHKTSFYPN